MVLLLLLTSLRGRWAGTPLHTMHASVTVHLHTGKKLLQDSMDAPQMVDDAPSEAEDEVAALAIAQLREDLFDEHVDEDGGFFDAVVVEEHRMRLFDAFALFDADGDGKLALLLAGGA